MHSLGQQAEERQLNRRSWLLLKGLRKESAMDLKNLQFKGSPQVLNLNHHGETRPLTFMMIG